MFGFTERLLGRLVALLAVAFLLTRTDMQLLALRAMFDLPFYLLIFAAALLEIARPRAAGPCWRCSRSPGCCGRRRGCSAGVYWLWLAPATPRRELVKLALLVVAAPVLWMLAGPDRHGRAAVLAHLDARGLGRVRPQPRDRRRARATSRATRAATTRSSRSASAASACSLAVCILRRRAALPLALGGLGRVTFLIIAAAGLSVIPRYMTIPSLLLTLCVAVALGGWTLVEREPRPRKVAIGIAVLSRADHRLAGAVLRLATSRRSPARPPSSRPSTSSSTR